MQDLDFPFGETPADEGGVRVAEGVHWLPFPLPFPPGHINLWALEDGDGWALVDAGFATGANRTLWERHFAETLGGRPVTRILLTHQHPDHVGLAAWLAERFGAPVFMTAGEWELLRRLHGLPDAETTAVFTALHRRHGLDAERTEAFAGRGNGYRRAIPALPAAVNVMADGEAIRIGGRDWTVLVGGGHTPDHAGLHCAEAGLYISGDQVLPRISSNIGVWPVAPEADPLSDYLRSLDDHQRLPADTLVLPSHGAPFRGLHLRLDGLRAHYARRLAIVEEACGDGPRTAADLLPLLFRQPLDPQSVMFAMAEAIGYVNHLAGRGVLEARENGEGQVSFTAWG
ncbi:MAG TPA: MBL fold metallo-hydrolase [Azospirillum sp.]|nr:MBL fold metallo-hydrolase [Azospirillum sp.]